MKFAAVGLSVMSGILGGIIAPVIFIGSSLGFLFVKVFQIVSLMNN